MLTTEFKFGEVNVLADSVHEDNAKVTFREIFKNDNGGVSMVAFKAGQKLDTHLAPAEVMVCVLEGTIKFTMLDTPHEIHAGEFMLMGAEVPHSVDAITDAKLVLIKVKP